MTTMEHNTHAMILLVAIILAGSIAGVMQLYSHTIMRGLRTTDDRTFVSAFQAIDRAIINPMFMCTFFGGLIAAATAAFVVYRDDSTRHIAGWVIIALILYILTVVITIAVHVPLNDQIKAAGDPGSINLSATRKAFNESRWTAWSHVRTLLTTASFVLLVWSMYLLGSV